MCCSVMCDFVAFPHLSQKLPSFTVALVTVTSWSAHYLSFPIHILMLYVFPVEKWILKMFMPKCSVLRIIQFVKNLPYEENNDFIQCQMPRIVKFWMWIIQYFRYVLEFLQSNITFVFLVSFISLIWSVRCIRTCLSSLCCYCRERRIALTVCIDFSGRLFCYKNMCLKCMNLTTVSFFSLYRLLNIQWLDLPLCDTDCDNQWKTVVILCLPAEHYLAAFWTYLQQSTSQLVLGNTRVETVWSNWRWEGYR